MTYILRKRPEDLLTLIMANVDGIFEQTVLPDGVGRPEHRTIFIHELMRVRPIFKALLENGDSQHYGQAALMHTTDPDDWSPKWFVGRVVGNISETDDPNRLLKGAMEVHAVTLAFVNEWLHNPVDTSRLARELSSSDGRRYLANILRWLDENKSTLIKALTPW